MGVQPQAPVGGEIEIGPKERAELAALGAATSSPSNPHSVLTFCAGALRREAQMTTFSSPLLTLFQGLHGSSRWTPRRTRSADASTSLQLWSKRCARLSSPTGKCSLRDKGMSSERPPGGGPCQARRAFVVSAAVRSGRGDGGMQPVAARSSSGGVVVVRQPLGLCY